MFANCKHLYYLYISSLITKADASAIEMAETNMQQKAFLRIRQIKLEFPDAIVGLVRMEHITEGWVVKLDKHQNFEGESGMLKAIDIAEKTTKTVAGWTDGEQELWDVVEIFDNEELATEAGKEYGQMTIYQIETGTLKWLM
jgi:hypothetical protein